jgi:tetratricopeptide (TPR) repeat protein
MVALQRHDYARAAGIFEQLLHDFPREGALVDRARVYLGICQREQAAQPEMPLSVEERLTAATASLNDGDNGRAEQLVRFVLAENPEHDLALYLLAAVEARRGRADAALQYLSQAVAVSPEAGAQARHDPDFELLRGTEQFEELTEPPSAPSDAKPRRRRARAER